MSLTTGYPIPMKAGSSSPTPTPPVATSEKSERCRAAWYWWVSPRQWIRQIVRQDDTPHSIALGTAIGTFIAFTPTVGVQMLVVLVLHSLLKPLCRFNQIAALIAVYISNPITTLPIYWFNYWVGTFFVEGDLTRERLHDLLHYEGFVEWWMSLWGLTVEIGWPLLIGSVLMGLLCGGLCYPLMKWLVHTIQMRKYSSHTTH